MDAAPKERYLLLNFLDADPNHQYEIVCGKHIIKEGTRDVQKGGRVYLRRGAARAQGIVVCIKDKYEELEQNFDGLIKQFEQYKLDAQRSQEQDEQRRRKKLEANYIRTVIASVTDKATQPDDVEMVPKAEYEALKLKYEAIVKEHEELKAAVLEAENGVKSTFSKLNLNRKDQEVAEGKPPKAEVSSVEDKENNGTMVVLGVGGTQVPRHVYEKIKWNRPTAATRELLTECFGRKVLASHSLTGKQSNAFAAVKGKEAKPAKQQLNPVIVDDIIETVMKKCGVSKSVVRGNITSKCADDNKLDKRSKLQEKVQKKGRKNGGKKVSKKVKPAKVTKPNRI